MSKTEQYFGKNGSEWVSALYKDTGKSIPEIRANKVLEYFDKSGRDLEVCIDVGCGDGRFLASLQSEVCSYGLDFSPEMLSSAQERLTTRKNVELVQVDLNTDFSIALESVSADLISLLGIIHYIESPVNCLSQCAKLLKSKGVVAVTFRNRWFNLQTRSKYFTSPLISRDRTKLEFEVAQFESKGLLQSKDHCWGVDLNEEALKSLDSLVESANPNGINDDYWNPNSFEYWRQFSPVDCIKLGVDSGLRCIALAPIETNEHARLETCTVFVAIFESIL